MNALARIVLVAVVLALTWWIGYTMAQPGLIERANAVLAATPGCQKVRAEARVEHREWLTLQGQTKTENEKFDCHSAMFLKVTPPAKAVFNFVWSEEFRDNQVRR